MVEEIREEMGASFCCVCAEREGSERARERGGASVLQRERGGCMVVFMSLSSCSYRVVKGNKRGL